MAITQDRMIALAHAAHRAHRKLSALQLDIAELCLLAGQGLEPIALVESLKALLQNFQPEAEDIANVAVEIYHFEKTADDNRRRARDAHKRRLLGLSREPSVEQHLSATSRTRSQTYPSQIAYDMAHQPTRESYLTIQTPDRDSTTPDKYKGPEGEALWVRDKAYLDRGEVPPGYEPRSAPLDAPVSGPGHSLIGEAEFAETMAKANAKPLLGEGGGDLF